MVGFSFDKNSRLFRRRSTGAVVDAAWTRFAFPTWWHYDVLRGLENQHPGEMAVEVHEGEGRPSRWNTLCALRVLNWYSAGD